MRCYPCRRPANELLKHWTILGAYSKVFGGSIRLGRRGRKATQAKQRYKDRLARVIPKAVREQTVPKVTQAPREFLGRRGRRETPATKAMSARKG